MKIQLLNGGLANQAFQYIFARYYELSHPGQIMYLDDSFFDLVKVHNGYELEKVFGIKPHFLRECFDEDVWEYILEERRKGKSTPQILHENGMDIEVISEIGWESNEVTSFEENIKIISTSIYEPRILEDKGNTYYYGYWLNKGWFEKYREHFLNEFQFPGIKDEKNMEYERKILQNRSVSMYVRRGDYVEIGMAGDVCDYKVRVDKFEESLRLCPDSIYCDNDKRMETWKIFVFSDDISWCKEYANEMGLNRFGEIIFVEGNMDGNNYMDLYLMSLCEGMIISNSAFCFLAFLLNIRKKIIVNLTDREV